MSDVFYGPTMALVAILEGRFVKVETHEVADAGSSDLLWLEFTPDDALSEGEVLCISPATNDQALWFCSLNSAHRFGGWSTLWDIAGTSAEVIAGVQEALAAQG
jgi:hypothetical protein